MQPLREGSAHLRWVNKQNRELQGWGQLLICLSQPGFTLRIFEGERGPPSLAMPDLSQKPPLWEVCPAPGSGARPEAAREQSRAQGARPRCVTPLLCTEASVSPSAVPHAGSECRQDVTRRCCPPAALPQPTQQVHSRGLWGAPAEAQHSTTWERVLIFKHMSNSSCNHMVKDKPHA